MIEIDLYFRTYPGHESYCNWKKNFNSQNFNSTSLADQVLIPVIDLNLE